MARATSPLFDPNGFYRRATRDAVFADGGVASVQRFLLGLAANQRREGWAMEVPRAPQKWSELDWLNRDLDRYLRRGTEAAARSRVPAVVLRGSGVVVYVADTTLPNPEPHRVIPNDAFGDGALDIGGLPNGRRCLAVIVPEKLLTRLGQILVSEPPAAPAARPVAVTFTPDDRPLVADSDGTVWEFIDGAPRVVVSFSMPLSACVSAGSEIIGASPSRAELAIWNGSEMRRVPMPGPVTALARLRSGELVTGGTDGLLRVWDLRDWRTVHTLDLQPGAVAALTAHPDGTIFAAGAFGGLRAWRPGDSEPTWELEGPEAPFTTLAPYGAGVVAFDERGRVAVWLPPQSNWFSDPDAAGAVLGTATNGRVLRARADGVIDEPHALDFHPVSEVAQLPPASDRPDPGARAPVKPLRPEEVIRQLFRWDALAAEQPDADQRRRAFQLSAALANAPALEGVVANGRFRVAIPFTSPPRLETGTYILVALGHPYTAV